MQGIQSRIPSRRTQNWKKSPAGTNHQKYIRVKSARSFSMSKSTRYANDVALQSDRVSNQLLLSIATWKNQEIWGRLDFTSNVHWSLLWIRNKMEEYSWSGLPTTEWSWNGTTSRYKFTQRTTRKKRIQIRTRRTHRSSEKPAVLHFDVVDCINGSFMTSLSDVFNEIRKTQNREDQEECFAKIVYCRSLFHLDSKFTGWFCKCSHVRVVSIASTLCQCRYTHVMFLSRQSIFRSHWTYAASWVVISSPCL